MTTATKQPAMLTTTPAGTILAKPVVMKKAKVTAKKSSTGRGAKPTLNLCPLCKGRVTASTSSRKLDGKLTYWHDSCYPKWKAQQAREAKKAKAKAKADLKEAQA
jgi:hypothetical protein